MTWEISVIPVSYTHLDVYKRQSLDTANAILAVLESQTFTTISMNEMEQANERRKRIDSFQYVYCDCLLYTSHGYAREAAIACREYAFHTLKLDAVYSIIRDTNYASQKVALANNMKPIVTFVKHYYGMDMPHIAYEVKNPCLCLYVDSEFDAVRYAGKHYQCVISLGAVLCDFQGNQVTSFYERCV